MIDATYLTDDVYFAPLLPWQEPLWTRLTQRVQQTQTLPHALLAAGMTGIGKRAFIWRLVAWLLCRLRDQQPTGACGSCESCQWLRSGTHPSLQVLPIDSMPISEANRIPESSKKSKTNTTRKIKIDDIRALQPFIYQGGQGMRICVLDYAEQMTIAAANALLKTLEEPQAQVHLFLLSDVPALLLPTIKSRVQQLPLQTIEHMLAQTYVTDTLNATLNDVISKDDIEQLLRLANGAPLAATALATTPWYSKRSLWLTTWQALRSGARSSVAASDYWQDQLDISAFITLTELMLVDMRRICLGLDTRQPDVKMSAAIASNPPSDNAIEALVDSLNEIKVALGQNVQDKYAYDKLMHKLALL